MPVCAIVRKARWRYRCFLGETKASRRKRDNESERERESEKSDRENTVDSDKHLAMRHLAVTVTLMVILRCDRQ